MSRLTLFAGCAACAAGAHALPSCSTWHNYLKLKLPSALPGLFAGLKILAPLAITASIIVELIGAPDGIGVQPDFREGRRGSV
ncbi:ABC transporter permease subunit [Paenibacillus sp. yr247]|uniref:ABC transporter permease subunit n=1 Tax=Paenibacillus sp. yr247 TaxID=1761880 RepID=UPI0034A22D2D